MPTSLTQAVSGGEGGSLLPPPLLSKIRGGVPPPLNFISKSFLNPGRMAMQPKRLASISDNSVLNAFNSRGRA